MAKNKLIIIPPDVEENILSRVPVKTIVRFMSVCKSWYSLFLNPSFINIHRSNSPNNSSDLLLMKIRRLYDQFLVVADTSVDFRFFLNYKLYKLTIVDSCDGIVCFQVIEYNGQCYGDGILIENIYLWNPALKVVKNIMRRDWCAIPKSEFFCCLLGIGFDGHSKDYKVISFKNMIIHGMKQVEIYSVSLDSWRTVKASAPDNILDIFKGYNKCISGVCINGVHHWEVTLPKKKAGNKFTDFNAIISFDMGEEVFKETVIPSEWMEINIRSPCENHLFNYNESLAILRLNEDDFHYYIWVRNINDMLAESWTKLCRINPDGCFELKGFVQPKNEVIFRRPYPPRDRRIVFGVDKWEVNDNSSTTNVDLLEDAREIMGFKESLLLLGSNNLVHL